MTPDPLTLTRHFSRAACMFRITSLLLYVSPRRGCRLFTKIKYRPFSVLFLMIFAEVEFSILIHFTKPKR